MPILRKSASSRELAPARVGLLGLVAIAVAVAVALNLGAIQRLVGGSSYEADFAHASGLVSGNPVEVSGLRVGSVENVRIEGTHVVVRFQANGVDLGSRTRAAIKTASAVGSRYLALSPTGSGHLTQIPLSRTSVPYDLTSALGAITTDTADLDVDQLARALDAVSQDLDHTPESFRGAITGVDELARVVAGRDQALQALFQDASRVSSVLADRSDTIVSLMNQGNQVLAELSARRTTIHTLLEATRDISTQLSGLVHDNRAQLRPALQQLDQVVGVLRKNEASIDFLIDHVGGYARNLGEAVGGGPFFYGYVGNLVPVNIIYGALPLPATPLPATPLPGTQGGN